MVRRPTQVSAQQRSAQDEGVAMQGGKGNLTVKMSKKKTEREEERERVDRRRGGTCAQSQRKERSEKNVFYKMCANPACVHLYYTILSSV